MALTQPTFGGYVNITEVVSAAAQTEIIAEIEKLAALIPTPTDQIHAHPDFDAIRPEYSEKLHAEIDALQAAIDAAPTA